MTISAARHQQSRDHAGEEQRADRDVGRHAVDDHRQRRRDDRADRGRRRGEGGRDVRRVAFVRHRLDLERAESARVRHGGARRPGEEHARHDVGVAEPAAHPADAHLREGEDARGDARRVHDVAHQDEQRRREQRKRIDGLGDTLRDREIGDAGELQERDGRESQREPDRRPQEQRDEPDREDHEHQRRHPRGLPEAGARRSASASASASSA